MAWEHTASPWAQTQSAMTTVGFKHGVRVATLKINTFSGSSGYSNQSKLVPNSYFQSDLETVELGMWFI